MAMRTRLRKQGITDERVLNAMADVDREHFVPAEHRPEAYDDTPLPIGYGQTISQPYIVAYMLEQLDVKPEHTVLEVGAGSGYVAALLAELCTAVVATERVEELAARAERKVAAENVRIVATPMTVGYPPGAPYDRIIVSASAPDVPQELVDQLADCGRMLIPVGDDDQWLYLVEKRGEDVTAKRLIGVRFVPLIG